MSEPSDTSSPEEGTLKVRLWGLAYILNLRQRILALGRHTITALRDPRFLTRFVAHFAVVMLIGVMGLVGPISLPALDFEVPTATPAPSLGMRVSENPSIRGGRGGEQVRTYEALFPAAVPHTTIPDRPRRDIITYTVQSGDTLIDIGYHFRLQWTTILWSNPFLGDMPDLLRPGQVLIIPPVDGVYHIVREGETLESIAKKYDVSVEDIVSCPYNNLEKPYQIVPGQGIMVPGGKKPHVPKFFRPADTGPFPADALRGTGTFIWPARGRITDRFGYPRPGHWHTGLDIANVKGTPIYAADSGYVRHAGWTHLGYGVLIIIDHGNGYSTYYAHLNAIYVQVGESVEQGQLIGAMGSTGNSTGPHLHFEVRVNGIPQDPEKYLP